MTDTMAPVTLALVNDYELVLAGLNAMLQPYRDRIVVVDRAVDRSPARCVDVSLFDTYGAAQDQLERLRELTASQESGAVIVFSFSTSGELVRAALGAGATGFVSKTVNARQLAEAVVAVADGHHVVLTPPQHRHRDSGLGWPGRHRDLSGRDSELLVLLRQGYTNKEIAERLYLSENTVKTHLRRLFAKLGVSNRTQAAMVASEDAEFQPRTARAAEVRSAAV
jgi:DNA-binding NarL/FixJ family response regulator